MVGNIVNQADNIVMINNIFVTIINYLFFMTYYCLLCVLFSIYLR